MSETRKVDPASLEELETGSISQSSVDLATLSEEEVRKYREIKDRDDTWLDDATEKELYEELLETLAAVIDDVLPGYISIFIRERWIEKAARLLFTWVLKQLIKALSNA